MIERGSKIRVLWEQTNLVEEFRIMAQPTTPCSGVISVDAAPLDLIEDGRVEETDQNALGVWEQIK